VILNKSNIGNYPEWLESARNEGGVALLDKDLDWTSFDVVAKLRSITRIKKIGHAGTLDPLATGLLIICFGHATKQVTTFQDQEKSYSAEIKLGCTTKSYDSEFPEEDHKDFSLINELTIISAIQGFTGKISQYPPPYSAKQVNGKRMYRLARKNVPFEITPVEVEIHKIEIETIKLPFISVNVTCSKGTYIRSLAHDVGQALGCGAYLSGLRRTGIGEYSVDDAVTIKEVMEAANKINEEVGTSPQPST
jgi:tRNA pseudouridine55 synthase